MSYRSSVENERDPSPAGGMKVYVGNLPPGKTSKDLEELFSRYGKISESVVRSNRQDPWDAENAIRSMNGHMYEGSRLIVEPSRRSGNHGSKCFMCGKAGHWVRECPENTNIGLDIKSGKCFKCERVGHLAKHCRNYGGYRDRSRSPRDRRSYRSRHSPRRDYPSSPYYSSRKYSGYYERRRYSPRRNDYYERRHPIRRSDYHGHRYSPRRETRYARGDSPIREDYDRRYTPSPVHGRNDRRSSGSSPNIYRQGSRDYSSRKPSYSKS